MIVGTYKLSPASTFEIVSEALRLGVRHFDTATLYRNEKQVGDAVKLFEEPTFITTKILKSNIEGGRESILRNINASLEALGEIDLLLLHSPTDNYLAAWDVLVNDVNTEKIRHVGVSNYKPHHMETMDVQPWCNQFEMSPYLPRKDVREYCTNEGIKMTAHSTLGKGKLLEFSTTITMAKKYHQTPCQIILQWIKGNGVTPIFRTSDGSHLRDNLNIGGGEVTFDAHDLKPWCDNIFSTHPKFL